ncbi:MAG TPA: glycosyltransferase family 2 protein [Gaiellaceae bacterium]|jgi:hypothetical protein|nr:glycosyltransferase family 2 protein [Gaiellaceae bacterium]
MTSASQVDIVVVSYNTHDLLRGCLESLASEPSRSIRVVDSGSSDRSAELVEREFPSVELLTVPNRGFGAAANRGIAAGDAAYVLLLNADTSCRPGAVDSLARYLAARPAVGLVGPRLVDPDGTLQPSCFRFLTPAAAAVTMTGLSATTARLPVVRRAHPPSWSHDRPRRADWVKGAAIMFRREALTETGGFDESFFMYGEELDLCYRLRRQGWESHFTPSATVVHVDGASSGGDRARIDVQVYASLMRFYRKHYSRTRLLELRALISALMLLRIARDAALLAGADPARRRELGGRVRAWRQILAMAVVARATTGPA